MKDENYWIEKLQLVPHQEGGYFREVYRSIEKILNEALPPRYRGDRAFSTSIYYLLKGRQHSSFHKLQSDEKWNFYFGSPLVLHLIDCSGYYNRILLGVDINKGEFFQFTIHYNTKFAAEPIMKKSYSLVGCTVAPGFDFYDFEQRKKKIFWEDPPSIRN